MTTPPSAVIVNSTKAAFSIGADSIGSPPLASNVEAQLYASRA
jgi:hypothetical protein